MVRNRNFLVEKLDKAVEKYHRDKTVLTRGFVVEKMEKIMKGNVFPVQNWCKHRENQQTITKILKNVQNTV